MNAEFDFVTIPTLCDELGEPRHRIEHVISSRRIRPCGKIGVTLLFSREAGDAIRATLKRIDERHAELRFVGDDSPADAKPAPAVVS